MTNIYSLHDQFGKTRYVGKTCRELEHRLSRHLTEAGTGRGNHRCCWLRSVLKLGLLPTITLLEKADGDGCAEERKWIRHHRENGCDLVNATDGGEGLENPSLEVREKIGNANRGKKRSAEAREKMRVAHIGYVFTTEQRRKIGEAGRKRKGEKRSAETCRKISESKKGVLQSVESRLKRALTLSQRYPTGRTLSVESRQKISRAKKGKSFSAEHRINLSHAQKRRFEQTGKWFQGERAAVNEWGRRACSMVSKSALQARLDRGWTMEQSMLTPRYRRVPL